MTSALILLLLMVPNVPDDPPTIADLEAYGAALQPGSSQPPKTVGFRDLWDHPEAHAGHRVRVEGRLARLFRQPAVGTFPPLTEAWIVTPAGDPFCLVYPSGGDRADISLGATVRFTGTFLRRIKYRGGDTARLAPLIVGPGPPDLGPGSAAPPMAFPAGSAADWAVGLGAAVVVVAVLARRHLTRPPARLAIVEPPPRFVDGPDEPDFSQPGAAHDHD